MVQGPDVPIGGGAITSLALVLHEFVTNSVKYGALQSAEGFVEVNWVIEEDKLRLRWQEHGGPSLKAPPQHDGFGSLLARRSVEGQLGGELSRDWPTEGLVIQLIVPVARLVK
jgi:two-component system CheB/CheR fusion protein